MTRYGMVVLALCLAPLGALSAQQALPSAVHPTGATHFSADACDSSFQRGSLVARSSHSTSGWQTGGFVSGLVFSFVGVAGATVFAGWSGAAPDSVPDQEVSSCYRDGYSTAARSRNRSTAFRWALLGALVLPAAYIIRLNAHYRAVVRRVDARAADTNHDGRARTASLTAVTRSYLMLARQASIHWLRRIVAFTCPPDRIACSPLVVWYAGDVASAGDFSSSRPASPPRPFPRRLPRP